jgi:hypothetical protein
MTIAIILYNLTIDVEGIVQGEYFAANILTFKSKRVKAHMTFLLVRTIQ